MMNILIVYQVNKYTHLLHRAVVNTIPFAIH